tara:strand:+ start:1908 stop:2063 length:156 start_codon:yes stop_codon:yes gene_type:complete
MNINEQFINILRELVSEELRKRSVLLESPVKSEAEILVENRTRKILKRTKK